MSQAQCSPYTKAELQEFESAAKRSTIFSLFQAYSDSEEESNEDLIDLE